MNADLTGDRFWAVIGDSQLPTTAWAEPLADAVMRHPDDAVVGFWLELHRFADEYFLESGGCASDGRLGEAVEAMRGGRASFQERRRSGEVGRAVVGEEGLAFVEALAERYEDLYGAHLPTAMTTGEQQLSWTFGVVQSMHGLPSGVVRGHDAAFEVLQHSAELRDWLRSVGASGVAVAGALSHDPFSAIRDAARADSWSTQLRSGVLQGLFVWPTAELLDGDFESAVARVRRHVARLAKSYDEFPAASLLDSLDALADPSPHATSYFDDRQGWTYLFDARMTCIGKHALRFAFDRCVSDSRPVPVKLVLGTPARQVSWRRFQLACVLTGQRPARVLALLLAAVDESHGSPLTERQDRAAVAAVLRAWPRRALRS